MLRHSIEASSLLATTYMHAHSVLKRHSALVYCAAAQHQISKAYFAAALPQANAVLV